MKAVIRRFGADQSGATAIEYGLIASLIAVACITIFNTIGTNLNVVFNKVADNLK